MVPPRMYIFQFVRVVRLTAAARLSVETILACLLIIPTAMSGQEASRQQPIPTFASKTELVTVPVVVLRT
jgi:hypothetical protein